MASGDTLLVFMPPHNVPPASNYATLDLRNVHAVLDFDGNTDEEAVFDAILPRSYAGGGLTVNLHVSFTSATSGTSRWQVSIERMDASGLDVDGDSFDSAQSAGVGAPGTSGQIVVAAVALTNGQIDGLLVGEAFRLKVRRDADGTSGTDDITTDAELHRIEVKET